MASIVNVLLQERKKLELLSKELEANMVMSYPHSRQYEETQLELTKIKEKIDVINATLAKKGYKRK